MFTNTKLYRIVAACFRLLHRVSTRGQWNVLNSNQASPCCCAANIGVRTDQVSVVVQLCPGKPLGGMTLWHISFKVSALPPVGRLQSVVRLPSKKWFLTGKMISYGTKSLRFFVCFNIPRRSKRMLIDLDICSFEISFFQLIGGLKRTVTEELLDQILPFFCFVFLWGGWKRIFFPSGCCFLFF